MTSPIAQEVAEVRGRLGAVIGTHTEPLCVHELCTRTGLDPHEAGATAALLMFASALYRPTDGSPPVCGGAAVEAHQPGWFATSPFDYFFWSLHGGRRATADGLTSFGAEWQGALLAAKILAHSREFPILRRQRGMRPDLVV
ncbi:MAG TPA: hypothetical protein VGV89_08715 [Thermoplasmata archaeon]|nr:hypothetical protein [Thermoplasmata archaeon]